jgi:dihydrofolate synthase/folylpolyglutamate synthase
MRALLAELGQPHEHHKFIHIAGTNGKGSVAAICQSILTAAGFRTGLYTSPHLVSFCERFQVDGWLITETDVVRLVEMIRPLGERVAADPRWRAPTLFEFATAMALQYFRDQQVAVIAWETGLGGRLDATNVVTPLVSVITNIGFDHVQHLGQSLPEIAREKCGIIKPRVPVVTADRNPAVLEVIRATAAENRSPVTVVTEPARYALPLGGPHQRWNCATALAALRAAGFNPTDEQIRAGLQRLVWPGRFQVIGDRPPIVLDGAHNADGMRTLVAALDDRFAGRPRVLVLGVLRDKAVGDICGVLAPRARAIVCVPVKSERTSDPAELAAMCRQVNPQAQVEHAPNATAGLHWARALAAGSDVIVVTGSLFLVGETLSELQVPFDHPPALREELVLQ